MANPEEQDQNVEAAKQQQQKEEMGEPELQEKAKKEKDRLEEEKQIRDHNSSIFRKIYYDFKNPASLSTLKKLKAEIVKKIGNVSEQMVQEFLLGEENYQKFQRRKIKFPRRAILIKNKMETFTCDLASMESIKQYNKNNAWIFVGIDLTTDYYFLFPLKQKTTQQMELAFSALIARCKEFGASLKSVWSDRVSKVLYMCFVVVWGESGNRLFLMFFS